jgi:hypothetical protein
VVEKSPAGASVDRVETGRDDTEASLRHALFSTENDYPRTHMLLLGINMRHAFVAIVGERILWMLQQRRLFLTYFLFEALIAKSLHPALYALVSMARTIFYLLLLCLAEQAGFDLSFPIAVLT